MSGLHEICPSCQGSGETYEQSFNGRDYYLTPTSCSCASGLITAYDSGEIDEQTSVSDEERIRRVNLARAKHDAIWAKIISIVEQGGKRK